MVVKQAELSDLELVKTITDKTIAEVYPHYYPKGAVDLFHTYHNKEVIQKDILDGNVYLCYSPEQKVVGTVTIHEQMLLRLFVVTEEQGHGYGKELLNFAEQEVAKHYREVRLEASLSSKLLYLKRGYHETEYRVLDCANNDKLCYFVMIKSF